MKMLQSANQKVAILDSGPLINLSMNGLLYILKLLKARSRVRFVITSQVKYEVCERPLTIKRFELGALRIKKLIDEGTLESPQALNIDKNALEYETSRILDIANHSLKAKEEYVPIISEAETSCLSLSLMLSKRKTENIIVIDERTARILCEKPKNLERLMSKRLHKRVELINHSLKELEQINFIRSSELVYAAYKKNLTELQDKQALEALLYATKYKGASISHEEITALKKL